MATVIRISDVEACALGVVWQRGPCTAYAVRKEFAASTTPRWSASAGSIYPALRRLLRRGLVRASAERWGPRRRTRFAITARGVTALQRWVGPPLAAGLAGPAYDPLRTRACFLDVMSRPERLRFVREAASATRAALGVLRATIPSNELEALAHRGSALALEARLRWLGELGQALARMPAVRPRRAGVAALAGR